ncbi:tektin-3-like [Cimex lectularius]|uniref:Tektin n=1 Tax=Cimex lectularius TaxID=79782 RepID=A0A8I6RRK3_CIMLE|nr:tektin-3-like [Cimex lectularius]
MSGKTVMYTQLQPWSAAGAQPCMEPLNGPLVGQKTASFYDTPRPHPWRPTLGYETVELNPLGANTITNQVMDPCFTPKGMATEPLRFPNLVTGFDRNPSHAARAALYTRYTPYEWSQASISNYNEADTNRNFSERLRSDAIRIMRMTDEKTTAAQRDTGRRLGERLTDTVFWRNEVANELEKVVTESNLLQDTKRSVEKALQDCEPPLHIAQECLYHREHRQGIDLVHDQPEQYLLKEIENLHSCREKLLEMKKKIDEQLRSNRASQHELETDVRSKESALAIDNVCHQLNNFSRGINYYGGIDKYDNTLTTPETWSENSNRIALRSKNERSISTQLRSDAANLINACANEIWNCWNDTNAALARRSNEVLEVKNRLQLHLHKVQQEIFDIEKSLELLRKAIMDKTNPMKVAHTRLEARAHRKDIELCKDFAQNRLIQEVQEIGDTIEVLHRKLQEAEAQHQQLLMTRSTLEADLHTKVNSIFIDREKCLGMRRSFPITAAVSY